jgi:hypothetical protein
MTGFEVVFRRYYTLISYVEPYVFPNGFVVMTNTGYGFGPTGRQKTAPILARLYLVRVKKMQ